ncbi:hypothetical protein GCM10023333_18240 [Ferrimonas pelagia]|uniref:DUF3718 domain-containing protein n=1 Tax=Ferrimonas pelagia TaxID=1177826 RepID=A0ABP9EPN7_9GAMM
MSEGTSMRIFMAAVIVGVGLTGAGYSPASEANVEQLAASICDYVQTDDKNRLRKKLKDNRLKLRNIYDGIACNGNSLLRLAMVNG